MEQKKIGQFIAQQRKEKQMTQKQLGEALGISDKTVSKWETGHGLPDISMIIPLCEILNINVNELLSGEHLTQDMYPKKAEENIMHLMKDSEEQKKRNIKDIIVSIIWLAGFVVLFLSLQLSASGISIIDNIIHFIDMVSLGQVVFIMVFALYFAGHLKNFGNAFVLLFNETYNQQKLENAIDAVSLAEKTLLVSGVFCSIYSIIYVIFMDTGADVNLRIIAVNMIVSLYPIFYGITGVMVLVIVKGRLIKKLKNS